MNYPIDAITAKDKTEYLYISQESLRELHNKFVEWHENGLLQVDYDTFPIDIRKKYGFANSIDLTTLKRFINEDFMTRSEILCREICVERSKLSKADKEEIMGTEEVPGTKVTLIKSNRWSVDASEIEKAGRVVIG